MGDDSDIPFLGFLVAMLGLLISIASIVIALYTSKDVREQFCDRASIACARNNIVSVFSLTRTVTGTGPIFGTIGPPWNVLVSQRTDLEDGCLDADDFEQDYKDQVVSRTDSEHWDIHKIADSDHPDVGTVQMTPNRQLLFELDSRHHPLSRKENLTIVVTTLKNGYLKSEPDEHTIIQKADARTRVFCPISYFEPGRMQFDFDISQYYYAFKDEPLRVQVNITSEQHSTNQ